METTLKLLGLLCLLPAAVAGQQDVTLRLRAVLPPSAAEQVISIVQDATNRGLPGRAIANVALEGAAKGVAGEQISAAVLHQVSRLTAAREAIQRGGRSPGAEEIEAGALAMRMGVDGRAVSQVASSIPAGRSLAVPLLVTGELVSRGLPSDEAMGAVLARIRAEAADAELMQLGREAGRMLAQGMMPEELGTALAAQRAGFPVPVGVIGIPFGPPAGVPVNPGGDAAGRRPNLPRAGRP